jgi:hypothetical protein
MRHFQSSYFQDPLSQKSAQYRMVLAANTALFFLLLPYVTCCKFALVSMRIRLQHCRSMHIRMGIQEFVDQKIVKFY